MERETYLERIKKCKSEQKITNEKLSEMTGIPLGTLSKILAGISDSPKLANIVAISQALGCSLDYLMTGEPENTNNYTLEPEEISLVENYRMLDAYGKRMTVAVVDLERARVARQGAEEAIRQHDAPRRTTRGRRTAAVAATPVEAIPAAPVEAAEVTVSTATVLPVFVPRTASADATAGLRRRRISLYDMPVSAGTGVFLDDSTATDIMIPDSPKTVEADYALRISGDSMEPKYHSGDVLLVQNCDSVEEGELGIFVLDGSGYFKKYGGDRLISLNEAYAPIMLKDFSEISCCGRVLGKLKRK
jgi:SOS-response transcriptional repressor LexA/DNA-binding Xre family transcriptional regulator